MGCNCNCNGYGTEFDGTWVGTLLKYKVEITAQGFSMDEDDFEIEVRRGKSSVIIKKEDLIVNPVEIEVEGSGSGEGTTETVNEYYMLVDTEALGAGKYEVVTRAFVPDSDAPEGIRTELNKQTLIVATGI